MSGATFYLRRSDRPGARGFPTLAEAEREAHKLVDGGSVPHGATVTITRDPTDPGSPLAAYRWSLGDDGYAGWHKDDGMEDEER